MNSKASDATSSAAGRLYYKPRRRAGRHVRERREYAIARRREDPFGVVDVGQWADAHDDIEAVEDVLEPKTIAIRDSQDNAGANGERLADCAALPLAVDVFGAGEPSGRSFYASKPTKKMGSIVDSGFPASSNQNFASAPLALADADAAAGGAIVKDDVFKPHEQEPSVPARTPAQRLPKLPSWQCDPSQLELRRRRRSRADATLAETKKEPRGESAYTAVVGERALICGLVHAPQFNGRWGHIESYDAAMHRYVVRIYLEKEEIVAKLRPESLVVPRDR